MIARLDARPVLLLLLVGPLALAGQARAQIAVAGDLVFVEENVRPGASYGGSVTLRNTGVAVATANIYLTDVLFEEAQQSYVEPGTQERSNAGWVELELGSVLLEGGESASVSFNVTVPEDTGLHDSYWSMMMVENAPIGGEPTEQGVQIRSVTRYGIYLVTNMAEKTPLQLDFASPSLQDDGQGESTFSVSIANSGGRVVRPTTYMDLYDGNGRHVRRLDNEPALIFPDAQVEHAYRLGQIEAGTYTAIVVADAGGDDIFGARYTLQVDDR